MKNVIENSLKRRLEKLEIPLDKINYIIQNLINALIENRSLIPFSVKWNIWNSKREERNIRLKT